MMQPQMFRKILIKHGFDVECSGLLERGDHNSVVTLVLVIVHCHHFQLAASIDPGTALPALKELHQSMGMMGLCCVEKES